MDEGQGATNSGRVPQIRADFGRLRRRFAISIMQRKETTYMVSLVKAFRHTAGICILMTGRAMTGWSPPLMPGPRACHTGTGAWPQVWISFE